MKVIHVDIECDVDPKGFFPRSQAQSIICIGAKADGVRKIWMSKTHDDDKEILEQFLAFVKKVDPDVISGFFLRKFDLPYVVDRLRANGMDPAVLGRGGYEERFNDVDGEIFRDINLGERIVFDTYFHWAAQDDQLFGLPNRKLKTLAQHFAPDREWILGDPLYPKMRELVNTKTLQNYMKSDLDATELMFDIYYPVFQNVVEILSNVTMKEITENSKGFLGMHLCRTCAQKAGIAFEGTNKDRWGERAINKQAALTNTFIPNRVFHNPMHLDFSSMYPSIVMTFNISPETTRIVGFEDFGPFKVWRNLSSGSLNLSIPDEKLDENVLIEISSTEGELPKLFKFLRNLRKKIKAEMKKYKKGTPQYTQRKTKESAVKMLMNSATGYMGEVHARFADLAQYIAIVGIGRELFKELVSFIEHRRYGDLMTEYEKVNPLDDHKADFDSNRSPFRYVIEGDTDGIYLVKPVDLIVVNRFLDRLVRTLFKATENYLALGADEYDAIYCPNYKGKNYVLLKENKLTFKGVAFKSSRWPELFTRAVTELAIPRLGGEGVPRDIYNKWLRAIRDGTLEPSLYVMNMEVQSPEAYGNNCMPRQLAEQARERFHVEDFTNQSFSFVKTKRGYWIVARDEALPQLDVEYYVDILNQAVERLGMQDLTSATRQTTISDMVGMVI